MMELWPFSNFHDLNLDWIIKTIKTYTKKVDDFTEDMTNAWDTFRNYVNHEIAEMHRKFAIYVNVTEEALNTGAIADGAITEPKIESNFLKEIKNPFITPQMFGAVGDGVTDDTPAFNDMFDYITTQVPQNTPSDVVIPPGEYYLTDTVHMTKCTVIGYGAMLNFACTNKSLVDFVQSGSNVTYEGIVMGVTIDTTDINKTNKGLDLTHTSQMAFRDIYIYHCGEAIHANDSTIITFDRPTLEYNDTVFMIDTMTNNINISNADIYKNEKVFDFRGYASDIYLTDSYLEENTVDINCDKPTIATGLTNFVWRNICIVKANQDNRSDDTYVIKVLSPANISCELRMVLEDIRTNFTPSGREHHFAYTDADNNTLFRLFINANRIHPYYTTAPANTEYIFKAENCSYYMYSLIANGLRYNDAHITPTSGGILWSGIMNDQWNNVVRQQLTFFAVPNDPKNKSLYYNHYTDRLIFRNNAAAEKAIVAGNKANFEQAYTEDLHVLTTKFNELLTVLHNFDIINKT